ncbi:uncharacterized protein LOC130662709 [Hydractinia symbiolongicarpus]|uniref:uncharacterized protein LOC130662709 n=1 Tax=Hydractinia symbiolongicarpus TaxID=13093 RepID=UPI00254E6BC4|nr:uncharacterized protein LOC130662709 [Hydractinia symbiolongicarpus]
MKTLMCLVFCLSSAQGFLFGKDAFPNWNKLSVTFMKFSGLPMNVNDAVSDEWKLNKDACKNSTFFVGQRYDLKGDNATMLLFDSHGQIAGMQMAWSNTLGVAQQWLGGPIIDDGTNYHATVYFTEPSKICSGTKRDKNYVGDKMFILMGKSQLMTIPLKEDKIANTKWVKGRCFYGMGQHYWYDISRDMDCNNFFPFFLLYNKHVLNGFGFATGSNVVSNRVEHPPKSKLGWFFHAAEAPMCLQTYKYLSTQHVYLDKRPYLNFC